MSLTYKPFAEVPELDRLENQIENESTMNVSESERWMSGVAGAALSLFGLSRRSIGGTLLMLAGGALLVRGSTGKCSVYNKLGINTRRTEGGVPGNSGMKVEQEIEIQAPRSEVYAYWRRLENLPEFMSHVQSVEILDDRRSRWVVKGPAGSTVEWDAEIINEHRDEMLAWQSLPGAEVQNAGTVRFEDTLAGGTLITVKLEYNPPAGAVGAVVAKLFGEAPDQQLREDLRRFKTQMEQAANADR